MRDAIITLNPFFASAARLAFRRRWENWLEAAQTAQKLN